MSDPTIIDALPYPLDGDCFIGMDVPLAGTWGPEDVAFWTGTERYQPWKDVASFFRDESNALVSDPTPTTSVMALDSKSELLRRLSVIQTKRLQDERDLNDRVIEFGRYLAKAAEDFMVEQNRAAEAGETPNSEHWRALGTAIREFRQCARNAK